MGPTEDTCYQLRVNDRSEQTCIDIQAGGTMRPAEDIQAAGGDSSMIGQFGAGFYSSYPVSEKVRGVCKHNDDEQYMWDYGAGGSYTVQKDAELAHKLERTTDDIFWQEMISNASDALDKTCYKATTDPEETGIGTTRNELINNLGTSAKTGIQALTVVRAAGGDISMTEQLGVGFYSSYPVSEKVREDGKHNDDEQYMRESGAGGSYTAQKDAGLVHGEVKRHLNDLVKEHPECIGFPTELRAEKSKEKVVTDSEDASAWRPNMVEAKLARKGQLEGEIANMKEDSVGTGKALLADKKSLAKPGTSCTLKKAQMEERSKISSEELLALADTINPLNKDDALDGIQGIAN